MTQVPGSQAKAVKFKSERNQQAETLYARDKTLTLITLTAIQNILDPLVRYKQNNPDNAEHPTTIVGRSNPTIGIFAMKPKKTPWKKIITLSDLTTPQTEQLKVYSKEYSQTGTIILRLYPYQFVDEQECKDTTCIIRTGAYTRIWIALGQEEIQYVPEVIINFKTLKYPIYKGNSRSTQDFFSESLKKDKFPRKLRKNFLKEWLDKQTITLTFARIRIRQIDLNNFPGAFEQPPAGSINVPNAVEYFLLIQSKRKYTDWAQVYNQTMKLISA